MAPGGEMFRYFQRFGENALRHGSHEWLPYSKNVVRVKPSNNNLSAGRGRQAHQFLYSSFTKPESLPSATS